MANLNQSHFRFGKDDGTESGHTFWQLEDVNHSQEISANWTFLLRFCLQNGAVALANVDAQFQYNKNGAGWVNITTTSSIVKAVAVNAFTDAQTTTKRLSGTGTQDTSNAGCTEDGLSGGTANDIPASGFYETEAGLQVVFADVANGDTIQFQLTSPDATIIYNITPTLTIVISAPVLVIPTPIFALGGIVLPTVILGSLNIVASVLSAIAQIVNPTVILGSLSLTPSPASAIGNKVDPTVNIETPGVTVTPDFIFALGSKVDPVVILGSVIITPSGLDSVGSSVAPTVILGSVVIVPSTIDVYGGRVNPTVILGSISVTPSNAWVIASGQDPTVEMGGAPITPDAVSVLGYSIDPTVELGSTISIPSPIAVISDRASPTVVLGSLIVVNPIVRAGTVSRQFTYQLAGKKLRKYKPL